MTMPEEIRRQIKHALWKKLDELSWSSMSDNEHSNYYEIWTKAPDIGGKLGHFMDPRAVRVYIKDTLVKDFARERLLLSAENVLKTLKIDPAAEIGRKYIKPHGLLLADGRVVCWGKSRDWKHLLMAAFERQRAANPASSSSVVILESGKTLDLKMRELVKDASHRLGIATTLWLE